MVCETGNPGEFQDLDVDSFLVLCCLDCSLPARFRFMFCTGTRATSNVRLCQKLSLSRYRTIEVSVPFRFSALAVALLYVSSSALFAQDSTTAPAPEQPAPTAPVITLQGDENDPSVRLARETLDRVTHLVQSGALPQIRLRKAQEDLQDALDSSILKKSLYSNDVSPEDAEQMIYVAQRMVVRRQRALMDMQQLVSAGVISRAEAESSGMDLNRAQEELDWAENRSKLVAQMAAAVKLQKEIASLESQAETHPEWNGKVFTKYEGSGVFTPADLKTLETAYLAHFAKPLPISANGETAVHRSLGFDHRGRVDVAVYPDATEGLWLQSYLKSKRIPYFAFRAAVPHQATGAHIHVGPGSTKLALTD